jgi:hypothetical protein
MREKPPEPKNDTRRATRPNREYHVAQLLGCVVHPHLGIVSPS